MKYVAAIALLVIVFFCGFAESEEKREAKGLDMVSDTVVTAFSKANALLAGNLEITMSLEKPDTEQQFTVNAIGKKVPRFTAVKSGSSLHNDEPLR